MVTFRAKKDIGRTATTPGFDSADGWRRPFPRLPRHLVLAAGALALLSLALPNIAPDVDVLAAPESPVRQFVAVSGEMNLPTYFSVLLTVSAASSQALVGRLIGGRVGLAFYVTAALLLAMSFDDFTALHERLDSVGEALLPPDYPGYVWVFPGLIPAAVIVLAFRELGRYLLGPARRDLVLGIGLVLLAALGLESVNGFLDNPGTNGPPLQIGTHLEELCENLGMIILLRGSLSMLETLRRGGDLRLRTTPGVVRESPVAS